MERSSARRRVLVALFLACFVTLGIAVGALYLGNRIYPLDIHNPISLYGYLASPLVGGFVAVVYFLRADTKQQ